MDFGVNANLPTIMSEEDVQVTNTQLVDWKFNSAPRILKLDDYLKDSIKKYQNKPGKNLDIKNKIGFTKVVIAILGFATGLASLFKMGLI